MRPDLRLWLRHQLHEGSALLFGGLIVLVTAILLTAVLLWYGSPPLLKHQHAITSRLTNLTVRLHQEEVELDRLISLSSVRHDRLHWLVDDFDAYLDQLRRLLTEHAKDPALIGRIERLHDQTEQRRGLLEQAVRQHTLAATTYALLPALAKTCFVGEPPAPSTSDFLLALMQLPFSAHNGPDTLDHLTGRLAAFSDELPPETACERLDQHVKAFLDSYGQLQRLHRQLNLTPISRMVEELNHTFESRLQQAIRHEAQVKTWLITLLLISAGLIASLIFNMDRQIRALRRSEIALNKANALYRALSGINEVLVRAQDRHSLLQQAADILRWELGIPGVAILQQPDSRGLLHIEAMALHDPSAQERLEATPPKIGIDPTLPEGRGLAGEAWRSGMIHHTNDYQNDARFAPWLPLARQLGIHSMVAIPLLAGGRTDALIVMYHHEKNWFDPEVLRLLREIQEDLSFALEQLALRRLQREQQVQLQLAEVAFNTHEGIIITDGDGQIIRTNQALANMSGQPPQLLLNHTLEELLVPRKRLEQALEQLKQEGTWQGELSLRRHDGSRLPVRVLLTLVQPDTADLPDDSPLKRATYIVAQLADLSRLRQLERQLERSRLLDPVTELPNRQALVRNLQQVIDHIMTEENWGVLSIINIRHFKAVNDSLGHDGGDTLLKEVARRLRDSLSFPHLTARDANDEFVIMPMLFYSDPQEVQQAWQALFGEIEKELMQPVTIKGHQVQVEIYAGTTFFTPAQTRDAETLLNQAESALRQAKGSHTLQQQFYDSATGREATRLVTLRHQLGEALHREQLELFFQPILTLESGRIEHAEALIRWRRDDQLVSPAQFMPVLEQSPQLMVSVGRWVIDSAAARCARISQVMGRPFHVAINLSAVQFSDDRLEEVLSDAVAREGISPRQLTLEVTETTLVADLENTVEMLTRLKAKGFHVAIDDFGTGYSSLQYLQRFAVDKLKLDKTFVDDIDPARPATLAIPEATIAMAHALGARVVAEGVETESQLSMLQRMGCDMIQGYLIARPMPLDELIRWLRQR